MEKVKNEGKMYWRLLKSSRKAIRVVPVWIQKRGRWTRNNKGKPCSSRRLDGEGEGGNESLRCQHRQQHKNIRMEWKGIHFFRNIEIWKGINSHVPTFGSFNTNERRQDKVWGQILDLDSSTLASFFCER